MNQESSLSIAEIFKRYNAEDKKFIYTMISCPLNYNRAILQAIAGCASMSLKRAETLLGRMHRDGLLQGDVFKLTESWGYWPGCKFSSTAYFAILSEMHLEDIKTLALEPYCERTSYGPYGYTYADYAWLLMQIVARNQTLPLKPEEASEAIPRSLLEDELEILFTLLTDAKYQNFFARLDKETANTFASLLFGDIDFKSERKFVVAKTIWENIAAMPIDLNLRAHFEDWYLLRCFFCEGDPEKFLYRMHEGTTQYYLLKTVVELTKGDGVAAHRAAKKATQVDVCFLDKTFCGIFENFIYGLALYAGRQSAGARRTMEGFIKRGLGALTYENELVYVFSAAGLHLDKETPLSVLSYEKNEAKRLPLGKVLLAMVSYAFHLNGIYGASPTEKLKELAREISQEYPLLGFFWKTATEPDPEGIAEYERRFAMKSPLVYQPITAPWESILDNLLDLTAAKEKTKATSDSKGKTSKARVVYKLNTGDWSITPYVQRGTRGNKWSDPHEVSLRVFSKMTPEKGMTQQDLNVAAEISETRGWTAGVSRSLGGPRAVRQLVGHPYVYTDDNFESRCEVIKASVQIETEKIGKRLRIFTNVDDEVQDKGFVPECLLRKVGPLKVEVIEITEEQTKLIQSFLRIGVLPEKAEEKLTTLLERVSARMPVVSELLNNSEKLEKIKGSSEITVRLAPEDSEGWFSAQATVLPLENSLVSCTPGEGTEFFAVNLKGRKVQVLRDLKAEKKNYTAFQSATEAFADCAVADTQWSLDTAHCLEFLNAVRPLENVVIQWPEGEKLRVSFAPISFENMKFSVNKIGTWFEVKGNVALDGKTQLKMAELLRMVRESDGRFISLGDNEYVALTEGLKKQLAALDKLLGTGKESRLSIFNAGVVCELEKKGAVLNADKEFRSLQERIAKADTINAKVPDTLGAELRDYQVDGFEWMMRLASWGAGALLADDMGLGKTVQTIAALLSRAQEGPQLVVVPASVLFNWEVELLRFAPSLKRIIFNTESNREEALKNAGKGSVVLTTYGLLSSEEKALTEKSWATAVYDEAHNIKNRETKAFKAAVQVKADFRILLTGTPLQNHLAEIWSLFEVAVPGLLGSFNRFSERFVLPIERDKDREQQRLLKRIVSPFILRRTKADVLNELPEKTEMTVKVELSDAEKALYEQLRAETQISLANGEINPVQALAALLKLRQAACSPELVNPKLKIPSSKTEAFLRMVGELIENRHRALVFSQFTSHLALIRRALEEKGIAYLYLDGAASPAQRQKLVSDFEAGTMPLFLISLKAGGTGLNLTAADYVFHLDPWWNPAIEDQASDRAYRIGQDRPVTIYRLIAAGTVEEKILKLHSTKKSLADALLEGTEMSSRLGREEIMELLALAQ